MSVFSSQDVNQVSAGSAARTSGYMKPEDGREGDMGKGYRGGTESLKEGAEIPWERSA